MKVIFVTREGYNLSGARQRCRGFAGELRKYGVETEIFSFAEDLGAKYGEKELEMGLAEKIKYNVQALRNLWKQSHNSVIFIQRFNYHALAPILISLFGRNKFIFDCDDWNISENPVYYMGFYPSSKMEYLTRKVAKFSDVCIAASRFLGEYLSKFNSKVYYLPTGVDTDIFRPQGARRGDGKIVFSWIGTVYHRQMGENLKFILYAFSMLADKHENIFLDIAGEGRYFEELRLNQVNLRHKDRINFSGWIAPGEIPDYLSEVDIGLLPLIQESKFNKAKSPTKLFEYMALGKPAVSSNIGEAGHIIEDGKSGFLAATRMDFIKKMEFFIRDESLRLEMGKCAREKVKKNYSLGVLGRNLFEILRGINA